MSPVDTVGNNQNAHVIISKYQLRGSVRLREAEFRIKVSQNVSSNKLCHKHRPSGLFMRQKVNLIAPYVTNQNTAFHLELFYKLRVS